MPKTERILGYLPKTFAAGQDPSALRSVVGAFGQELQWAENSLAAVMRSHWVDFADSGSDTIADLACIGSLYGLWPRSDESVEEYREHLKRYVKAFLEGTVTVQGLLRITAAALHLNIDDRYGQGLSTWWDRGDEPVVTTVASGADATEAVFGFTGRLVAGADPGPAVVRGTVDLSAGVDLGTDNLLWFELDGGGTIPIDLAGDAADPRRVTGPEIVAAVNDAVGFELAELSESRLILRSATVGPDAVITVADGPDDAAPGVLGLPPRRSEGFDARSASLVGTADLANPVDLSVNRYLRIDIDGNQLAEIDAAESATDAGSVSVDEIVQAVNAALGLVVASHDGRFIRLDSPTPGTAGSITLLTPAAQDATRVLFGADPVYRPAVAANPGRLVGTADIGVGVDLRERSTIAIAVDGLPVESVDVAGADPEVTMPGEIVTAINAGLGDTIASHDGRFITLTSPLVGDEGVVSVEDVAGDATELLLGLPPRTFAGTPSVTAAITGERNLTAGINLAGHNLIRLSVDGAPAVEVDLRARAFDSSGVDLDELAAAVNGALGADVATDDGSHLILVSSQEGAAGSLDLQPVVTTSSRRFLSYAEVTDDAGTAIFGFTTGRAVGVDPTPAVLVGVNDLLAGADLREHPWIRLRVDDRPAVEIDCRGPRPRATTAAEVVAAINGAMGIDVALTDGHVITVVSPTAGGDSRIVLEPSRARDGSDAVGLPPGERRGRDATGVRFVATADLSAGVDLPADATIALAVDGAPVSDILVGEPTPSTRTLSQLVGTINAALGSQVASHNGTHLQLTSATAGVGSVVEIATPSTGVDVGAMLFGVGPRRYDGAAATSAEMIGLVDLTGGEPLGIANRLQVGVDGGAAVVVDLSQGAADPDGPTGSEMAAAINAQSDAVAVVATGRLRLRSPGTGSAARLVVERASVGDARSTIFGLSATESVGGSAEPATLLGEADLLAPVDLSDGGVVRLSVDDGVPIEVDVAAPLAPHQSTLAGIVADLNDSLADRATASATDDQRLQIVSSSAGAESSVELLALRRLEIEEYPPEPRSQGAPVTHGGRIVVANHGAAPSRAGFTLLASAGAVGPRITALDGGWTIGLAIALPPGSAVRVDAVGAQADGRGSGVAVRAEIIDERGRHPVHADRISYDEDNPEILILARTGNRFVYLECDDSRFDDARFDEDSFAGGPCREIGVFDASRFADVAQPGGAVFAAADESGPASQLTFHWDEYRAGALNVHLPDRLDERYGVRFNEGRFGSGEPERFAGVVTEPLTDPANLLTVINGGSGLVEAHLVPRVPIGWSAVQLPFRQPQPLTNGTDQREARIYLSEEGLGSDFIEIRARHVGRWANEVRLTARAAGPAIYDIEVDYPGGRFENARAIVAGWPPVNPHQAGDTAACHAALDDALAAVAGSAAAGTGEATIGSGARGDGGLATLAAELNQPSPTGVLLAKAAGVRATVSRDRVHPHDRQERKLP